MKLSKLFVIALLAGTLGVLGCNDETTGTAGSGGSGTAGSGGSGTAGNCDYGDCVDGSTQQQACEAAIQACMISPIGQEACIELANTDACGTR